MLRRSERCSAVRAACIFPTLEGTTRASSIHSLPAPARQAHGQPQQVGLTLRPASRSPSLSEGRWFGWLAQALCSLQASRNQYQSESMQSSRRTPWRRSGRNWGLGKCALTIYRKMPSRRTARMETERHARRKARNHLHCYPGGYFVLLGKDVTQADTLRDGADHLWKMQARLTHRRGSGQSGPSEHLGAGFCFQTTASTISMQ